MRVLFSAALIFLFLAVSARADVFVKGYFRSDGTYVAPHHRSSPNGTKTDNYSSPGNTNPWTGTRAPGGYSSPPSYTSPPSFPTLPKLPSYPDLNDDRY